MALPASAVPTFVMSADTPPCDVLADSDDGTLSTSSAHVPPFPVGEQIVRDRDHHHRDRMRFRRPSTTRCIDNALVSITNLNAVAFSDLWYVADYDTTLTNIDGTVLDGRSRRSRSTPSAPTQPLVFESGWPTASSHPARPGTSSSRTTPIPSASRPTLLATIGLPSAGLGSSGSIIALPVPEPTTAALLGLGLLGLALGKRRQLEATSCSPDAGPGRAGRPRAIYLAPVVSA